MRHSARRISALGLAGTGVRRHRAALALWQRSTALALWQRSVGLAGMKE
jgi:hypothetical protein